jgi:[Skp1-protein]-hydroxyproline N-acetylglucosaminyltransferase
MHTFSFSSNLSLMRVPYDSRLTGLFFGEETVMAARLWTNGFDFFAPCQVTQSKQNRKSLI